MYCYNCMRELTEGESYCRYCKKETAPDNITHHLVPGTVLNGKYMVGNSIGEGGFGITYIGRDMTLDMRIAIKEFFPNGYANRNNTLSNDVTLNYSNKGEYFKQGKERFLQEAKNIAKFSSERGIVDVRDYFEENNTAYIIMEYLDGITLSRRIDTEGAMPAEKVFNLMLPIISSLDKMHSEHILHRDISPDNIMLLNDGTLKLMDFGSARYFTDEGSKTMSVMFKPGYAPYEQYNTNGKQGPWTDVYGLCATMYKCITGSAPIDSLDRYRRDNLQKPSMLGINISASLENVLMYGLAVYTENRCPSMRRLRELIEQALIDPGYRTILIDTSKADNEIYQTRLADEQYKTMFIDGARTGSDYSDNFDRPYSEEYNRPIDNPQNTPQNKPKKKNGLFVFLIILLCAILLGSVGAVAFIMFNQDDDSAAVYDSSQSEVSDLSQDDSTVEMIDVRGMSKANAKKELEDLGLNVEIKTERSDSDKKGKVMRQSYTPGTKLQKGDEVTLTVSFGKHGQKIVVKRTKEGISYATLSLLQMNADTGKWDTINEYYARVGREGISSKYGENNSHTPKGTFPLGVLLYGSNLDEDKDTNYTDTESVTADTVISEDVNHNYNMILQNSSGLSDFDPIGKRLSGTYGDESNNILIFIEHNGNGKSNNAVRGKGSAITICGCITPLEATGGCIDISSEDMEDLICYLDSSQDPVIEIK